jgi:hypothetical protein
MLGNCNMFLIATGDPSSPPLSVPETGDTVLCERTVDDCLVDDGDAEDD